MACRVQKRISLRRKLHILRVLTNSNSAKRTSIAKSTVLRLNKLKLALETVKRQYENLRANRREYISLLNHVKENKDVKIEKVRPGTFMVRVTCEKGGDKLVAILEAFDDDVPECSASESFMRKWFFYGSHCCG
ncbi:hypothetical protein E2542_SST17156 [Spatholobus suberectus]|nr:hypothetical protein E2542_SST17156 [Spatholobus suberectus]